MLRKLLKNGIIADLSSQEGYKAISNYDFLLDAAPNNIPDEKNKEGFSLQLSPEEFDEKQEAAMNYPELRFEVEKAIERFGKSAFYWESFRKVTDVYTIANWNTTIPYYEEFGKKRIRDGLYKDLITFEDHIRPIAEACMKNLS